MTYAGTCEVWDVRDTRDLKLLHVIRPEPSSLHTLAVHHGGKWIATVGGDHAIRVWDAITYAQLHQFPAPKTKNGVVGLFFQPGTDNLFTAQAFEGMQIITLGDVPKIESLGNKFGMYSLAFSPDGTRIAIAKDIQNVVVRSFPQFEQIHVLQGHSGSISDLRFSPDGKRLATCSYDKTVRLWDMMTGQELLTLPSAGSIWLAFSADGQRLAASGNDALRIWDTAKGRTEPPAK